MTYTWKPPIRHRHGPGIDPCHRCRKIFYVVDLESDPSNNLSRRIWVCHQCANEIRKLNNQRLWDYEANKWQGSKKQNPDQLLFLGLKEEGALDGTL